MASPATVPTDPLDHLRTTGEKLPAELRDQLLVLGASAVPALVELVLDEELGLEDAAGQGWPPIHAVGLLVDLKATEAIEPLLDVVLETTSDHVIHDRILFRLPELGASVLEPALARLADTDDEDARGSLLCLLSELGVRDERIFEALCDAFDDEPGFIAGALATYGDPRALELIEDAIDRFEPDFSSPFWRMDLNELVVAHASLGGTLDDELRDIITAIDEAWAARPGAKKVGRNDPCPCRSGKKYKKCCLGKAASPADGAPARFSVFARELVAGADGSPGSREAALALARFLWDLALEPDDGEREARLQETLDGLPPDLRDRFEENARAILERHREMFPELQHP